MVSKFQITNAARIIQNEGVVAYPTESVFGLGCDPLCRSAVEKILHLKHRPEEKGLILIAASLNQLKPYIEIDPIQEQKILECKSPMTWLVAKSEYTPRWIHGKHPKVAIRVSQHPLVIDLCMRLKHPITSTSANPANANPAKTVLRARAYFHNNVDVYLSDKTGLCKKPTQITDIDTNSIIRSS